MTGFRLDEHRRDARGGSLRQRRVSQPVPGSEPQPRPQERAPSSRSSSAWRGQAVSQGPNGRTRSTRAPDGGSRRTAPRERQPQYPRAGLVRPPARLFGVVISFRTKDWRTCRCRSSSSTPCQRSPSSSPRRRPVESATVVMRRAEAYQYRSSSSARASSSRYARRTAATFSAVSVSVSGSWSGGGSTSSSGFSVTHRHRLAGLKISPKSTQVIPDRFRREPVAQPFRRVPLERLR